MPCGFGLRTGDRGGDTADGAGNGRPTQPSMDYWEEPGASRATSFYFFFLRYGTADWPGWSKGGKEGLCVFECFKVL